jgi:hypothetical protein
VCKDFEINEKQANVIEKLLFHILDLIIIKKKPFLIAYE